MGTAANEDVDVHLPCEGSEHFTIAGWHDLLAVYSAYTQRLVVDREGEGEVVVLRQSVRLSISQS